MFSPMSAGEDQWPQPDASQTTPLPSSSSSAAASALSSRPRSPQPPLASRGAPPGRILATGQRVGDFFSFASGSAHTGVPARTTGRDHRGRGDKTHPKLGLPGSLASLEPTGWNQQHRVGFATGDSTESRPFLRGPGPRSVATTRTDTPLPASTSESAFRGSDAYRAQGWYINLFRPSKQKVEQILDGWYTRQGVLCLLPSLIVWVWCAVPFPKTDKDSPRAPWCDASPDVPWCRDSAESIGSRSAGGSDRRAGDTDANFWFFLLFYYGIYAAVALVYITQLFSLYRLNWWPAKLGAKTSYTIFWLMSITAGYLLHRFQFDSLTTPPDGVGVPTRDSDSANLASAHHSFNLNVAANQSVNAATRHMASALIDDGGYGNDPDDIQWQRKTLWVGLAFATMAMPALVCLIGLRRSGRQTYRHSLTDMQKTFLERQLARRIPASYIRFLWFISTIGLSLVALLAGQGYASVYLSTLPHTGLDGTAYVTFWMTTVNLLAIVSHWILEEKVRSRALLFANKYYYFLVYFIFYRNLFARLRSFDQFALVQLLSSFWVCIWYPFSMTPFCHRIVSSFTPSGSNPKSWEEYVESVALAFYVRNLAQNVTMVAFLGWVTILHFHGQNHHLYPFFAFSDRSDPYNYQLTMLGSGAIWASELVTSFLARAICKCALGVDVTNLGLDEMRQYPDLLPSVVWTSVHVCMDMLLFLIKLNFR
ncbi:unnamed protein product [Parajaminaea phylloscopi]